MTGLEARAGSDQARGEPRWPRRRDRGSAQAATSTRSAPTTCSASPESSAARTAAVACSRAGPSAPSARRAREPTTSARARRPGESAVSGWSRSAVTLIRHAA
ncbi:hypothetical protein G5V59_17075 [Nocardioides sp. W3-2-3]|uniref:hypothetical protein n=1 Tax=Nocardioides convexus TaxID=2712224 RepID=UPI003100BD58|nr:hypothetical protein [Nocardioides convexus]